jgi:hypothetical protein
MSLVRIARIAEFSESQVIASALRAAGVTVFVQDELLGRTMFIWQQAIGGFGILVPEEQAAEAAAFIRRHRTENFRSPEPDDIDQTVAPLADDEDWGRDAQGRKAGLIVRWIVVAIFVGPTAFFFASLVLHGVVSAFTGR